MTSPTPTPIASRVVSVTTDLQRFATTGDTDAFARVVRGHVDLVYSLCRRELRDASLADDATQAVFILLAQKAAGLTGSRSLVGWLYTAAQNCSRNARRASLRRERHEMEAARGRPELMEQQSVAATIEQAEVAQAVHQAMSRLDAGQRDLLLMRFFQRMTLGEVGRAVGITEDAARQRVGRAIRSLRAIMERGGGVTAAGALAPAALLAALPTWLESHAVISAPPAVTRTAVSAGSASAGGSSTAALIARSTTKMFAFAGPAKWAAVFCIAAAGLFAVVAASQPATSQPATSPGTALPASQPSAPVAVTVRALIDGRDHLILKGSTAQWRHFDFAAPGLIGGRNEPTTINGIAWHPTWDDSDVDKEVRVVKSMSDKFEGIQPPVPATASSVTLEKLRGRGPVKLVQEPSPDNEFTTIVEFDDNVAGGAAWYEVKLTFTPQ